MDTYADYTNIYDYLADGKKIRHDAWDGRNHAYRGSLVYMAEHSKARRSVTVGLSVRTTVRTRRCTIS